MKELKLLVAIYENSEENIENNGLNTIESNYKKNDKYLVSFNDITLTYNNFGTMVNYNIEEDELTYSVTNIEDVKTEIEIVLFETYVDYKYLDVSNKTDIKEFDSIESELKLKLEERSNAAN